LIIISQLSDSGFSILKVLSEFVYEFVTANKKALVSLSIVLLNEYTMAGAQGFRKILCFRMPFSERSLLVMFGRASTNPE